MRLEYTLHFFSRGYSSSGYPALFSHGDTMSTSTGYLVPFSCGEKSPLGYLALLLVEIGIQFVPGIPSLSLSLSFFSYGYDVQRIPCTRAWNMEIIGTILLDPLECICLQDFNIFAVTLAFLLELKHAFLLLCIGIAVAWIPIIIFRGLYIQMFMFAVIFPQIM
jgi:hypothetical protein